MEMSMNMIKELSPAETAKILAGLSRMAARAEHEAVLRHAAFMVRDQYENLQAKTKRIIQLEQKIDKLFDPEAIRALGFLEGVAFGIEDDVLYESVKDALGKISGVLKQGG